MAHGLQILDQDGNVKIDTSSTTWMQVDYFEVAPGSTSTSTITKNYTGLPATMELKYVPLIKADLPTTNRQILPTIAWNSPGQSSKILTITPSDATVNTTYLENVNQISANCFILILGR